MRSAVAAMAERKRTTNPFSEKRLTYLPTGW
jgi:hypothetical protein